MRRIFIWGQCYYGSITVKFTVTPNLTSTPIAIGLHEEPDQLQTSSGNYVGLRVEPTEYLTSKQVVAGSSPVPRSTILGTK